jgi:autotransporter-associated beta strand protein
MLRRLFSYPALAGFLGLLFAGTRLCALTSPDFTWSPSALTGDFNTAANWQGGVVPTSSSNSTTLTFSGWSAGTPLITLGSSFEANAITFNGSSVNYQFAGSGGASLKLGSGGLTANGGATITLLNSLPIVLLANQTWQATNATNLLVQGMISGAFGVTKTGSYDMTLSGANTFTGGLTVAAGSLTLGSSSVGVAGAPTAGPAGVGLLTLYADTSLHVSAGGAPVTLHNNIFFNDNYDPVIDTTGGDLTLLGTITGAGSLTKNGPGTLTLGGANTYTGDTELTTGTLLLGSNSFLDGSSILSGPVGRGDLDLASGTTLTITSGATRTLHNDIHLGGNGTVTVNTAGGSLDLAGYVHNLTEGSSATLDKTGAGTLILSNDSNDYAGATTITAGTLTLGADNAIPETSRVTVTTGATLNLATFRTRIDALSGAGTITLGTGKLTVVGEGTSTFSGLITGAGSLTQSGTGYLTLSGANTFTGGVEVEDGTLYLGSSSVKTGSTITSGPLGTGMLKISDDSNFGITAGNLTLHNKIELSGYYDAGVTTGDDYFVASNLTLAGLITGTNGLYKYGYGSLTLSGANTFSGGLTVGTDSLLLGASSTGAVGAVTASPVGTGTLVLGYGTTLGVAVGTGATTLHNSIDLDSSSSYDRQGVDTTNGNLTLLGTISGSGGLNKIGPGSLTLSGANIYTGDTTVTAGTLLLGSSSIVTYLMDPWDITSSPVGTGELELLGGTTLAPVSGAGLITLFNPVIVSGNITIGLPGSTDQLRIDTKPYLYSGLNASGRSKTVTVAGGILTLASGPGESYSVENFVVQNGAALIFAFKTALPNTGITANTGSYVGVANGVLDSKGEGFDITSPYSAANLIAKITPATFAGTFGFDSEDPLLPATYAGTLDFAGFTHATFGGLSTASAAIIGSTATLFAPTGAGSSALAFSALNSGYLQVDIALLAAHNFTQGIVIGRDDGRGDKGTVALTNSGNTYTGGTTIKSGTLTVRDNNALGTGTITAVNAAIAPTSSADAPKLTTTANGRSALGLTLANALVVNTSYASGAYGLGIGGIDDFTLSGAITGTGVIDKYGPGTLTITGDGTAFAGKTNVLGGTLRIGNGGSTGSLSGNIVNSGSVIFDRYDNAIGDGILSGTGAFTKLGAANLTLTAANTATGAITISAGTLTIGGGGTSGSIVGNVTNNATLAFNRSDAVLYAGVISGTGSVRKEGAGTLTLTGANTYSGPTNLQTGNLAISTSSVFNGTNITSGPLGLGELRFLSGNHTLVNTAPTTILHNAIDLGSENTVTIDSGTGSLTLAGSIQGGRFFKTGTGTLTLSGTNTYGQTTVSAGTLAVAADANLGSAPATPSAASITLDGGTLQSTATFTLNANRGIALNSAASALSVATGTTLTYGGAFTGTAGLTLLGGGTLLLSGSTPGTYTGATTITNGTLKIQSEFALPVTTAVTVAAGGVLSAEDSFTIGSLAGSGSVLLKSNKTLTVNQNATTTFSGVIANLTSNGSLTKTGIGTLFLSGANTYSGTTTVSGGSLVLTNTNGSGTGSGNVVVDSGGTLTIGNGDASGSISGNIDNSGLVRFNRSDAVTYGGIISNVGSLTKVATGTLTLSGANTYSGLTTVSFGTLTAANATGSATGTGNVTVALNGTLDIGNGGTTGAIAGNIANFGNVNFRRSDDVSYAGVISGSGFFYKYGAGTLTFTSDQTFTDTANVMAGSLAVGNGGTGGAIVGNVFTASNTTLIFNRSSDLTYAGMVSGSGALVKQGAGKLTLTGTSIYLGSTTVNGGTLSIGSVNALPSSTTVNLAGATTLDVANNQTLAGLSGPASSTVTIAAVKTLAINSNAGVGLQFDGTLTGSGALTKSGTNSLNLTAANTYTGGTTITAGTLTALNASGSATGSGTVTINGGALQIGGGGTVGSVAGNVVNNASLIFARSDNLTYGGVVSGSGSLSKSGAGTLTLTGQNTYGGNTTVSGGTLEIDVANALPTTTLLSLATGSILDVDANQTVAGFFGASGLGATLDLATGVTFTVAMPVANTTTTFAGSVTGGGVFAVSGAGGDVVNLTGSVTNTGGTLVGNGATLIIGTGGTVSGPITTTTGSVLTFNNTGTQTLSNTITGSGGISVTTGITTLSGNNTYSGPTSITGGKLLLTGSNTGGGTITVGNGAVFGGTGFTNGPLVLNGGSAVSPGASPGILTVGATTFAGGARFAFEINSTTAAPGVGWDLLSISGALTITATPANPFIIDLTSLDLSNNAALLTNFNNTGTYSWQFVSTTGGVTGFNTGSFQYNASQFQNSLGAGHFFVSESSGNLFLNFTPVPEPSTYALLALGLGVIVVLSRRRRS